MVIKCPECNTRFNLSADRIRPEGSRVRCAKCRHIFLVWSVNSDESATAFPSFPPNTAIADSATDDLWWESLDAVGPMPADKPLAGSPSGKKPESTAVAGRAGLSEADLGLTDLNGKTSGKAPVAGGKPPGNDEGVDEFGFEDEIVIESPFAESSSGPLTAAEFFPEAEPPESPATGLPDFSFEKNGLETFSFDMGPADSAKAFPPEEKDFFAPDAGETKKNSFFDDSFEAPTFDDLPEQLAGSQEGLDFKMSFGASHKNIVPAASEGADDIVIGRMGKARSATRRPASFGPDSAAESYPLRHRRGPVARVLRFCVVLLLVLGAIVGYLFWKNDTTDITQIVNLVLGRPAAVPASRIQLPTAKSYFVMNTEAGRLFVIHGEAVNGYQDARSAITVNGILHDEQGRVLLRQTVFCGNSMDLATLKTAPFARLEENMNNQFGDTLSNLNVAPGKAIPYMIVFRNLPPKVTGFTVEVADSRPGVPQ